MVSLIRRQVDEHRMQLSDVAVADHLAAITRRIAGAFARPSLQYHTSAAHGITQRAALADRISQRLFTEDVLACSRRCNADQRMPMVRGRDDHAVNARTHEHLAEVGISGAGSVTIGLVHFRDARRQRARVHIAGRHHAGLVELSELPRQMPTAATRAHHRQRKPLIRAKRRRRNPSRRSRGRQHCLQESPTCIVPHKS